VPRATLQKIIGGRTHAGTKPGQTPKLGQLESKLVDYAVNRAALGVGFGKKQFFDYVSQLAKLLSVALIFVGMLCLRFLYFPHVFCRPM
jgi:hypothetical protein